MHLLSGIRQLILYLAVLCVCKTHLRLHGLILFHLSELNIKYIKCVMYYVPHSWYSVNEFFYYYLWWVPLKLFFSNNEDNIIKDYSDVVKLTILIELNRAEGTLDSLVLSLLFLVSILTFSVNQSNIGAVSPFFAVFRVCAFPLLAYSLFHWRINPEHFSLLLIYFNRIFLFYSLL